MRTDFAGETAKDLRPRLIASGIIAGIVLAGAAIAGVYVSGGVAGTPNVVATIQALLDPSSRALNPVSLFYTAALGGLFFLPIPLEVAFLLGLRAGSPPIISAIATIGGFALGNLVSYFIGWKLSRYVTYLISTKKLYSLRRTVNRYGAYAIFGLNLIPAPSPVLTFALGTVRYNVARLFLLAIAGNILKLAIIVAFSEAFF